MNLMKTQHGRLRFLREKYDGRRRLSIPERIERLGIDRLTVGQLAGLTRKADPNAVYNLVIRPKIEEYPGAPASACAASAARTELFGKTMLELPGLIGLDSMNRLLDRVQEIFQENPLLRLALNSENRRMELEEAFYRELGGAIRKIILGGAVPLVLAAVQAYLPQEAVPYVPLVVVASLGVMLYKLRQSASRLHAIKKELMSRERDGGDSE